MDIVFFKIQYILDGDKKNMTVTLNFYLVLNKNYL